MSRTLYTLSLSLLLIASAFAQDFKVKRYTPSDAETALEAALDTLDIYADRLAVGRTYRQDHPDDIAVQMRVSDLLAVDNAEAVRDYYKQRAKENPSSIPALYLAGRVAELVADRQDFVRQIFALDPDSYWGWLLQATAYYPEEDGDLKKTEAALRKAIAIDNSNPYAVAMLGELLAGTGRKEEADNVFSRMEEMLPRDFEPVQQRLMLNPGRFQEHVELLNDFLKRNPDHVLALDVRARVYRELNDWDGYIESMQRAVAISQEGVDHYNLACGFSLSGKTDSAYAHLFAATDAGFSDVAAYTDDDDLVPLHDDPRWTELLSRIEANHQQELLEIARAQSKALAADQKERVTERTMDQLAPDFTAKLFDGTDVTLADLRGKIVILDFWATWCGPCRRTMPLIDQFFKENAGDDVLVYGVNVWERQGTGGVKPFIEKAGYSFPILLAANEVAERYRVTGIPTMFVIDQEGRIAYKHVGYNPQIVQMLIAQTDELRK